MSAKYVVYKLFHFLSSSLLLSFGYYDTLYAHACAHIIEFTPSKVVKPLKLKGLLDVKELETGELLRSENRGRVIRTAENS